MNIARSLGAGGLLAAALFCSLISGHAAAAGEIRFYNWADYFDPDLIAEFEAETGITVVLETFIEGDVAEATLLAGGARYDLAVAPLSSVGRLIHSGAIQPLDRSRIVHAAETERPIVEMMERIEPQARRHTLLYLWGTSGLVFDEAELRRRIPDAPMDSWRLLFDPENAARLAECGISVVDSMHEVLAAALAYLGRDPRSDAPEDIDDAFAVISEIAPFVKSFSSSNYDALMSEEICLALTWSTEGVAPAYELEETTYRYVTPVEGTNAWFDVFVLPTGGKNTEDALRFLDFIYRPEHLARLAEWSYAAGGLAAARDFMSEDLTQNPGLFPDWDDARLYAPSRKSSAEKAALDARWRRTLLGL